MNMYIMQGFPKMTKFKHTLAQNDIKNMNMSEHATSEEVQSEKNKST